MCRHSQKGSALLIVLGFLSFMVVSAVAFAIWMRNERLPSSALRRSVANRYLVKAALAQAMSRVDDAIRSHAFPGAWNTNQQASVYRDKNGWAYDWWESRVFMPPNPEGMVDEQANNSGNRVSPDGNRFLRYAPVTKTVSVLNLEALGYLPPSIINDVRLLARSSWTAQWDYFNFDAGRYAFCAVNVSDMLDINKIAADRPRTSAAAVYPQAVEQPPPSRFSLAYLFRKGDSFADPNGHDQFDKRVHTQRKEWGDVPFVSMMDYHLAAGYSSMGQIYMSPYFQYVNGDNSGKFFYQENSKNGSHVKSAERQPFVTSSWFPRSDHVKIVGSSSGGKSGSGNGSPIILTELSRDQPFESGSMGKNETKNIEYTQTAEDSDFWQAMLNNSKAFCQLDQPMLLDYLDEDNVPLSLAMPCVERVPMLTALTPEGSVKVHFSAMTPGDPVDNKSKLERTITSETRITVSATGMGLGSMLLFPFKNDGRADGNFRVQAFARLVFVHENKDVPEEIDKMQVKLRKNDFARNFRPVNENEWEGKDTPEPFKIKAGTGSSGLKREEIEKCLAVTLPSEGLVSWDQNKSPISDEPELKIGSTLLTLKNFETPDPPAFLQKIDVYKLKKVGEDEYEQGEKLGTYYKVELRPFNVDGSVVDWKEFENKDYGGIPEEKFNELTKDYRIRPYFLTWSRVVDQDNHLVDMVPATFADDNDFNNINNSAAAAQIPISAPLGNQESVHGLPIMRFSNSTTFLYTDALSDSEKDVPEGGWIEKSCYTVDPRFNWASENWWFEKTSPGSGSLGQHWYESVFLKDRVLDKLVDYEFDGRVPGRGDRASDPFLFVSNVGYLQSVGELAFLPHLSDMKESGAEANCVLGEPKGKDLSSNSGSLYNGTPRVLSDYRLPDDNQFPCALAAWKSYQNYRTNPQGIEFGANLYRRGLVNGSQGFYVNPFTQSHEVMLAALANTPLNYWVAAATNTTEKTMPKTFGDSNYKNYLFGDSSPNGVDVKGKDINRVATFLQHRFQDLASMLALPANATDSEVIYAYQKAWEDLFDILDWSGKLGEESSYTIQMAYDHLRDYYNGGGAGNDYRGRYTEKNGYPALNKFAKGQGTGLDVTFTLDPEKAIYKNELSYSADPLQAEGDYEDGKKKSTDFYGDLYNVDRMFLHSYWRDCFANRQQLFLIFVRAESTALGGTGEGTPAQQGGRAVALVWRDPEPPTGQNVDEKEGVIYIQTGGKYDRRSERHPHKMRVLFYRQLD